MYQVVATDKDGGRRLKLTGFPTKREAQTFALAHVHPDIEVVRINTAMLVGRTHHGEWIEQTTPARRDVL